MPRQHLEVDFGRHHRRDLVDQCSAYACPMRAHARLTRRTTSTCRPARSRSSPATSRRAHPAHACVRRLDKAPRKTPEKLASPTGAETRNRWSGACTPARGARLTSGRGGGGHRPTPDRRVRAPAKVLAGRSCICSCIRTRLLSSGRRGDRSRETLPWLLRREREPLTVHVE